MTSELGENTAVLTEVGDGVQLTSESCSRAEALLREGLLAIGERFAALDTQLDQLTDNLEIARSQLEAFVPPQSASHWLSPQYRSDRTSISWETTKVAIVNPGTATVTGTVKWLSWDGGRTEQLDDFELGGGKRIELWAPKYPRGDGGFVEAIATGPIIPSGFIESDWTGATVDKGDFWDEFGVWYGLWDKAVIDVGRARSNMNWYPIAK
jgi:hypothetical protein